MKRTLIIAEAGVNHNGDILLAHALIDAAADAGADVIKFQTFNAKDLTTPDAKKANYQIANSTTEESQQEMLSRLELSLEDHYELIKHCENKRIEFLSTAFDNKSIDLLSKLNLKRIKIPSGELTNIPYIRKLCLQKKPVLLSTGMADLDEIGISLGEIQKAGICDDDITILHCTTEYPAKECSLNLNAIKTIKRKFKIDVGYSDHSDDIFIAIAATALGSTVLEKHLTLNREMEGPDHKASITPERFKQMVDGIRKVDMALGNGIKVPSPGEIENKKIARKSIVAAKDIKKGEIFSKNNLVTKRPGIGISPLKWDVILGKQSNYDFQKDDLIKF